MEMGKSYMVLNKINLLGDTTFDDWLYDRGESEEIILGVYANGRDAYNAIKAAIEEDDTICYCIANFCSCCGKSVSPSIVYFDPDQKQIYGVV